MRVVEEPFVTRDAILSVLRPGEVTSERPFRTLRERKGASTGLAVTLRSSGGQVLGRMHLYNALNADAARASRLRHADLATELAHRASILEALPESRLIHRAVEAVASGMPVDALDANAPISLRRYVDLRRRSSWRGLDRAGLARDWLAHSGAWLTASWDALVEAAVALSGAAQEARAELLPGDPVSVTTFFGTVARMDEYAAELDSDDGTILVSRDDLDRQGLAVLGQPVALLREELPSGGSLCVPMPAIALDRPAEPTVPPVWATDFPPDLTVPSTPLAGEDGAWIERTTRREPTVVPAGPLRVR